MYSQITFAGTASKTIYFTINHCAAEVERSLAIAVEREQISREECVALQQRLADVDQQLSSVRDQLQRLSGTEEQHLQAIRRLEGDLAR